MVSLEVQCVQQESDMILQQGVMHFPPHVIHILCHHRPAREHAVKANALVAEGRRVQADAAKVAHGKSLDFSRIAADPCEDILAVGFKTDAVVDKGWEEEIKQTTNVPVDICQIKIRLIRVLGALTLETIPVSQIWFAG